MGVDLAVLKGWWNTVETALRDHPWWLFAALVVLPGLPVPSSALMILAGTVWHERPLWACGVVLTALVLNMSWTYWVASRPARSLVERWILSGKFQIPNLPKGDDVKLILFMRLFPATPFFVQNYVLGFLRVPFRVYLPLSLLCTGAICCGLVLSAAGVADQNLVPMISGVGLITVGFLIVKMIRARMLRKRNFKF